MKQHCLTLLTIFVLLNVVQSFNPLLRRTRYGFVRGTLERSRKDPSIEYLSFMGIPYARPPVNKLRFQEPQPPQRWTGIKDTNTQPIRCVQFSNNFNGPDVIGSEDCLYINVFIPKTVRQKNLKLMPVMFWIHGGTFTFGSNVNAGPDYVIEKDVVLVSVQYRVNVFGFLSTKDEYATGNFGLKDQVMALKWVNENIRNFDGDPKRVMILGESAGGASVQYHLLSEKSQGLYQRAISHSGSVMDRWAHQDLPRMMVLRLAKGLGIKETDSKSIVEQLRWFSPEKIIRAAYDPSVVGFYTPYYAQPFAPIVETASRTAFISNSTYELLKQGKFNRVPYILGYNTEEGSFAYDYIKNGRANIDRYQKDPELLVPLSLNVPRGSICSQEALRQIKSFYFKNGPTNDKENWIKYMSQELFVRAIRKSLEFMYKFTPTYYYRFSYRGSRNESHIGGVGHHEELMYLWLSRRKEAPTNETKSDVLTRKRFVTMWTNFAATGNPTPENDLLLQNVHWPVVNNKEGVAFLDIGDNLMMGRNPDQKDYEFWEQLFELCGNPPYTGY